MNNEFEVKRHLRNDENTKPQVPDHHSSKKSVLFRAVFTTQGNHYGSRLLIEHTTTKFTCFLAPTNNNNNCCNLISKAQNISRLDINTTSSLSMLLGRPSSFNQDPTLGACE